MSPPRKRLFGPLTYSTLALAVVAIAYTASVSVGPAVEEWRDVRSLVQGLRAADPKVREATLMAFAKRRPDAVVPYLKDAVSDPDPGVRAAAFRTLADVDTGASWTGRVLTAAVNDPDAGVRLEVGRGRGRVRVVVPVNHDTAPEDGREPAEAVRRAYLGALHRLFKDRDAAVRVAAADAAAVVGPDREAAADLVSAAGDGDRDVRLAAAKALLAVNGPGDPSAARVLVALIADPEPVGDRHQVLAALAAADAETREQAVAALAGLLTRADPSVLPDVIDCLAAAGPVAKSALPSLEGLLKNKDANLRASVGIAVAGIEGKGSPRAVKVLVGLVSDAEVPTGWRLAALESVREANPSALAGATPDLIRHLGDTDAGVRVAAVEMLSQIVLDTRAELPGPAGGK